MLLNCTSRRAGRILELTRAQRPNEGAQGRPGERQGRGDHVEQNVHAPGPFRLDPPARRNALRVTIADEEDMATAATSGVAQPASATGTASAL
jgi:hypothetical protein